MSQKVRKTLIMIVMAALIICLMAASLTYTFTYGRYAGGKFNSTESPYDDLIEFVGAREYTVRSPEELIQAIKDGYSNIVIAEDAEEPFVITEGVTDVEANLVLNLNGNVVVRNSRNPMLDVQTNVSVVLVYDSKNTGAFYNPVGSSLMASGGSLTVGSGGYESGPRAEEYKDGTAAGTLGDTANATLFARSNETNNAVSGPTNLDRSKYVSDYSLVSGVSLPTITPKTTQENNRETVRGNVYLNSDYSDWLPADTFLIYTVEEDCFIGDGTSSGDVKFESGKLYVDAESETVGDNAETETVGDNTTIITASEFTTPLCNVASCDFYYYYPISGTAGTDENPQDYAVIYGYWDVMKLARDDGGAATALKDSGLIYPYGAVRMVEGEGIVRGGTFSNHFDAVNTYGIYAEGGTLSVSKNTTVDTTFTTGGEGVCIRSSGESAELTISGGDFSSEVGNTIEMLDGNMTVTKGSFTKTGCKQGTGDKQLENQTAIISLLGGTLNVSGAKTGDVTMTAGAENSTLENVFGIRADGGGMVTTKGVSFHIYGDYSAGVLSYDGTINLNDNTAITVTQSDEHKQDGKTLLTSSAVSSEASAGDHPINMSGNVQITSNGLGITARGNINIKEADDDQSATQVQVETTRATGIYVNGGTFKVGSNAQISVKSTVSADYAWGLPPEGIGTSPNIYNGVYVENGSIDASTGTLNVTFTGVQNDAFGDGDNSGLKAETAYYLFKTKSYAVRVEGSGDTTVRIASGNITNAVGGGVLVNGGTVTLGREGEGAYTADENGNSSGLTVETTGYGLENTDRVLVNNDSFMSWIYRCTTTGGDAVKIDGGTLKILGGQYQTAHGNGIFVRGAQAAEEDAYAVEISGGAFRGYNSSEYGENADLTGPAQSYGIKIIGGKVLVNGGTFGSSNVTRTNGSAFFMGLPDEEAEIKIQRGNFYSKNTDAVATFRYTDITFEDLSDNNQNINISVTADRDRAAVALQDDQLFSQGDRSSTVTINGGTYTANGFGVWYGCSQDNLNIQKGIFTGINISGLYFNVHPTSNGVDHVTLSGGTYYGKPDERIYLGLRTGYANGAIGAPMNDSSIFTSKGGLGNDIQLNQIMPDNALAGSYPGSSSDKLCDTVSRLNEVTITLQ